MLLIFIWIHRFLLLQNSIYFVMNDYLLHVQAYAEQGDLAISRSGFFSLDHHVGFQSHTWRLARYRQWLAACCPALLDIDGTGGEKLTRQISEWVLKCHPPHDWTFPISLGRWLMASEYANAVRVAHLRCLLAAAAMRWVETDRSPLLGIVLLHSGYSLIHLQWKGDSPEAEQVSLPFSARYDFAWTPIMVSGLSGLRRWLQIPI